MRCRKSLSLSLSLSNLQSPEYALHLEATRVGKEVVFFLLSLSFLSLSLSKAKSPEYALHLEAIRVGEEVNALGHDRRDCNL